MGLKTFLQDLFLKRRKETLSKEPMDTDGLELSRDETVVLVLGDKYELENLAIELGRLKKKLEIFDEKLKQDKNRLDLRERNLQHRKEELNKEQEKLKAARRQLELDIQVSKSKKGKSK